MIKEPMPKNTPLITPIILCGGSGTRLWPLSRQSYPKQFASLLTDVTLFQASAKRLSEASETKSTKSFAFNSPLIVTNSNYRFIVTEQLAAIDIDPGAILIEPMGKNTAPAILATALYLSKQDPDAIMLVAPSDHAVTDINSFYEAISTGVLTVAKGDLVTFGIEPDRPETGYGYLELTTSIKDDQNDAIKLSRFVEKPDAETAVKMLASKNYLWNAGIFLFNARDIIVAFEQLMPDMMRLVKIAVDDAKSDLGFLRLAPEPWAALEAISIDYAVMEKVAELSGNLSVVPFFGGWSDLGGWDAVWRESIPDKDGVVTRGDATAINCHDTLLRSENEALELVGMGLDNIIAIAMNDAVLIADMSQAQNVGQAVAVLKEKKSRQATLFPKDHRPWGWFESLVVGSRFQVKRILVHPGAALSLQSHFHRSEHWIVVEGTAAVTVDDTQSILSENQSIYIPLGAKHRLMNPGKIPMILIEVQTGTYVGEDDIIRYEDVYART